MELYELLVLARKNDNDAVMQIIQRFKPKIKKSLYQTSPKNREDLEQELITKFIEVIQSYEFVS
ncbi:helix-turn-helix domain-containing protein [Paenibacillus sp. FSL P4-0288]|uniref:helix-turn-helix domain-containing protein n=1 Tax=Paenibacillus sp. FSL P4-0288 TaxID=2921633 RepID=UPI0030F86DE2